MRRSLAIAGLIGLAACGGVDKSAGRDTRVGQDIPDEEIPPIAIDTSRPVERTKPEEPAAPTDCQSKPRSKECRCDEGDSEACLAVADAAFMRGEHDPAIIQTYTLCKKSVADACFRAARYMKRLGIAERFGSSPSDLQAEGIAMLQGGCAKSDPVACYGYGRLLFAGRLVTGDAAAGKEHLQASCDAGHAPACAFLASAYEEGRGGLKKDKKHATELLDAACKAGGASSCTVFADRTTRRDKARARELYTQACDGDDGPGCGRLGAIQREAGEAEQALATFLKGCELEHTESCADAGALTDDPMRARELFELACQDDKADGCAGLAANLAGGQVGARNWGRAVETYDKACKLGQRRACKEGKRLARTPPDWHCAAEVDCQALCDEHIAKSCTMLGNLQADSETNELLADPDAAGQPSCFDAQESFGLGCTYGDPRACLIAGTLARRGDSERTLLGHPADLYGKACKLGEADGCALRDYSEYEDASAADQKKLARSLDRKCGAGRNGLACVLYARLDPEHDERAVGHVRKACDRGSAIACATLIDYRFAGETGATNLEQIARRACELGDYLSCVGGDDAMEARGRDLFRNQSCGRGGIEF